MAMPQSTKQAKRWNSDFGRRYTDRHPESVDGFNELREKEQYGVTQLELLEEHLGDLDRDLRILEVGTNVGVQLRMLQKLGFHDLYGIDVSRYAIEKCANYTPELGIAQADALHLPFRDNTFDLVFTNETLVTIAPEHIDIAIDEIARCSNQWIWGLEHYADEYTMIEYRGLDEMLWKTDFPRLYMQRHDNLELIDEKRLEYLDNDNLDMMFMLKII